MEKSFNLIHYGLTDTCSVDTQGNSLIHWASYEGLIDLLNLAITDNPEKINLQNKNGQTALHFARSSEVFHLLINAGLDIDIMDNEQRCALAVSFKKAFDSTMHQYLTQKRIKEHYLLHLAGERGLVDSIKYMLFLGANVNQLRQGRHVLSTICSAQLLGHDCENPTASIKALIDAGASIEPQEMGLLAIPELVHFTFDYLAIKKERDRLDKNINLNQLKSYKNLKL